MRVSTRLVALALVVLPLAAPHTLRAQVASSSLSPAAALVASSPADTVTAQTVGALPGDSSATVQSPASVAGAPLTGLRAGVHTKESAASLQPTLAAAHGNIGQSRAMMVVGVAGLIVGAIIGGTPGTIIMVGGAVVGLVGLYDYLQ